MISRRSDEIALWHAVMALFLGGFAIYALFYCTQPLLPIFSACFNVSPTLASLSLSVTTAGLIVGMQVAPRLSGRWGRKSVMTGSLVGATVLEGAAALSPSYEFLLAMRALQGVVLAGFPANAMAYVGEEFRPQYAGTIMGLYISGITLGGMLGRLTAGWFTEWYSWRVALFVLTVVGAISALWFSSALPASRHRGRAGGETLGFWQCLSRVVKGRRLLYLYICGFLLMGAFMALFNYVSYHLMAEPYSLSPAAVGSLFLLNLLGILIAPFVGRLTARYSHAEVLTGGLAVMLAGCLATLPATFEIKLAGLAFFSAAFAANHTIISSWVVRCATFDQSQAAAWYLTFYYAGSVAVGTAGGPFWSIYGWPGVVALVVVLLLAAFAIIGLLRNLDIKNEACNVPGDKAGKAAARQQL